MQTPESQSPAPALALAWENLAPWFGCSQGTYPEHTLVLTHGIAGGLCWPRCSNGSRAMKMAQGGLPSWEKPLKATLTGRARAREVASPRQLSALWPGRGWQAGLSSRPSSARPAGGAVAAAPPQDSLTPSRGKLTATAHSSLQQLIPSGSQFKGSWDMLTSPPVKPAGLGGPGSFSPSPQGSSPTHPGAWCQHPQGFKAARRHPSPGWGVRCCRRMERQWEMGYAVSARSRAAPPG